MSSGFIYKKNIDLFTFRDLREDADWYFIRNPDLSYSSSVARKTDVNIDNIGVVTVQNSYVVWDMNYALYVPLWKSHISRCLIMDNGDISRLEEIVKGATPEEIEFLKAEQLKK